MKAPATSLSGEAKPYRCAPLMVAKLGSGPLRATYEVITIEHVPHFTRKIRFHELSRLAPDHRKLSERSVRAKPARNYR